ncbi:MAG TPA: aminoacyl-tRNA hydrolase [Steroidobacteraceae bacterium]|nr:aminoacyl-tRNA hydrolase [Steroidobacteraceae bacterium]
MPGLVIRLVVGLGNPGPEYAATRHNAGFWFVDELARRHEGHFKHERRYGGETCRVAVGGRDLWLLKPMAYMNRSGTPVRALCDYLQIPAEEVLVAHDDLDLPPGTVRLKRGGGAGGHNGLKDTITHLGEDFWRLRLGIGRPAHREEVIGYVLRRPGPEDEESILKAADLAAHEFPHLLTDGPGKVMNRLHTRPAPAESTDGDEQPG